MQEAVARFTVGSLNPENEGDEKGTRPEWLPENFNSPEDFAASYKALQAELTRAKQGDGKEAEAGAEEEASKEGKVDPVKEAEEAAKKDDELEKGAEAAGVDIAALQDEFAANGALSDASYEKLGKMGFNKEFVDEIIADRQDRADRVRNGLMEAVGGEDRLNEMVAWAGQNYDAAQIKEYNEAVNSANVARIQLALKALKADYEGAVKTAPKRLLQGNTNAAQGEGLGAYKTTAEMQKDISDPRYRKDPTFRAQVMQRLAMSQGKR